MAYTAIVLDADSRQSIREVFETAVKSNEWKYSTKSGDTLPHHMTINMGQPDLGLNPDLELGSEIEMVIDGICHCKHLGVAAARVTESGDVRSINEQPHITIAIQAHGKPFNSNQLAWDKGNWYPCLLKVKGTIQLC
jgi:hypothetical protein